jgi:hypothetical protein
MAARTPFYEMRADHSRFAVPRRTSPVPGPRPATYAPYPTGTPSSVASSRD